MDETTSTAVIGFGFVLYVRQISWQFKLARAVITYVVICGRVLALKA